MVTKIQATNFLSWKDLRFSVNNGITLIDGWNEDDQTSEGSGKSAVFNALSWAIYGKIPKDANMDDVIKHGESSCDVEVWFDNGYVIKRTRKPNDLVVLKEEGDNYKSIKGKDARETQKIIEEFIGLSFEAFCQSVYFAQNNNKKWISANQDDRGKILSEIQDLQIFDRARKETMSLLKLESEGLSELNHKIQLLHKDIELVDQKLHAEESRNKMAMDNHQSQLSMIQQSVQQLNDRKTFIETQIQNTNNNFPKLTGTEQQDKEALRNQITSINLEISKLDDQKRNINTLINNRNMKQQEGNRYGARYKALDTEQISIRTFLENPAANPTFDRKISTLVNQIKDLQFHLDNPNKPCPTCGTEIQTDPQSLEQVSVEISDCRSEVTAIMDQYRVDLNNKEKEKQEILSHLNRLSEELKAEIPTATDLDGKISKLTSERNIINTKINQIESLESTAVRVRTELNSLNNQLSQIQQDLQTKSSQYQNLVSNPPTINRDALLEISKQKTMLQENIVSTTNLRDEKIQHISRLETLKSGFKEIKSYVFISALNEINARIQKYLDKLFEVPVKLRFTNDNMKIGTEASINGNEQGLGLMSGGQFRRLSLATDLALSDVVSSRKGNKINIIILDEYFKDLSEQSMEKCLHLLESRKQPVLLVEHNSIFKNIVNNTFFAKYQNGTTTSAV